jgi:hypothetical protein
VFKGFMLARFFMCDGSRPVWCYAWMYPPPISEKVFGTDYREKAGKK